MVLIIYARNTYLSFNCGLCNAVHWPLLQYLLPPLLFLFISGGQTAIQTVAVRDRWLMGVCLRAEVQMWFGIPEGLMRYLLLSLPLLPPNPFT